MLPKRPQENLDAQLLCVKYVYGQLHGTPSRPVINEWKLSEADGAKATVSMPICNEAKLYQSLTFRNERQDELPSWLKV